MLGFCWKKKNKIYREKLLLRQKFQISCSMTITSTKICPKNKQKAVTVSHFQCVFLIDQTLLLLLPIRWGNSSRLERYKNYSWYLFCFFFSSFSFLILTKELDESNDSNKWMYRRMILCKKKNEEKKARDDDDTVRIMSQIEKQWIQITKHWIPTNAYINRAKSPNSTKVTA